ncbi:hypothetical protein GSI_00567 [Ganoderma sinense ZZ0214-1]|uniref:HBS1-like protein N-terminal domain-containing protein n=1 Tax=Ganoderma sinense ZZ0214-1 TaxID=1077348 RepID=A0A2G8SSX8_9APHY|nr:hypothetical protein GSI_00567 [Ganoderma sinense ZZ0214-1]
MSRHRYVRNIDINEEMEDDVVSDGGYDDLSPEDHERMMNGLEHIRNMIGDAEASKLSDEDIAEALYHFYFDVEQATAWLLEEQERRLAAQARKDIWYTEDGKVLPMAPPDDFADWSPPTDDASGRHNVPFVRLTSNEYVSPPEQGTPILSTRPGTLYTITELTEHSEVTRNGDYLSVHGSTAGSSTITDYGQILTRPTLHGTRGNALSPTSPLPNDPSRIPLSPSSSAEQRLSLDLGSPTGPPLLNYSDPSSDNDSSRPPTVVDFPSMDNMPDIPDWISKSTLRPQQGGLSSASLLTRSMKPSEDTTSQMSMKSERSAKSAHSAQSGKSEKKSKLSTLASSRSSARSGARSSVSSISSSQSSVPETEATLSTSVTYPKLRPAATSFVSLLPAQARPPSTLSTDSTSPSSLTRNVEQAIQSALALEAMDRRAQQEPSLRQSTIPPTPPPKSPPRTRSKTPSETQEDVAPRASPIPLPLPRKASVGSSAPPSVAQSPPPVAQFPPLAPRTPPSSPPRTQTAPSTSPQPRQLSKLAKLAQAKAQEQGKSKSQSSHTHLGLALPRTTTEYLMPTANGPTATTAITTSYQSLSGLLSKHQVKLPPSQPTVAPLPRVPSTGSAKSSEPRQSKLAMKSKTSRTKTSTEPEPEPEEAPVVEVPMFSPSAIRTRALPSAFATLLVSDEHDGASNHGSEGTYLCQHHKAQRERRQSSDRSRASDDDARPRSTRSGRVDSVLPLPPTMPSLRGFAFDVPSPDDIVYNARKGTSLAQRSTSSTASSALSAAAR